MLTPLCYIAEIANAYTVYVSLEKLDSYSVDSLLSAHDTVIHSLFEEAILFCSCTIGVADDKGIMLHMGTLQRYVPENAGSLWEGLATSTC